MGGIAPPHHFINSAPGDPYHRQKFIVAKSVSSTNTHTTRCVGGSSGRRFSEGTPGTCPRVHCRRAGRRLPRYIPRYVVLLMYTTCLPVPLHGNTSDTAGGRRCSARAFTYIRLQRWTGCHPGLPASSRVAVGEFATRVAFFFPASEHARCPRLCESEYYDYILYNA